jgi:hypothetical protein
METKNTTTHRAKDLAKEAVAVEEMALHIMIDFLQNGREEGLAEGENQWYLEGLEKQIQLERETSEKVQMIGAQNIDFLWDQRAIFLSAGGLVLYSYGGYEDAKSQEVEFWLAYINPFRLWEKAGFLSDEMNKGNFRDPSADADEIQVLMRAWKIAKSKGFEFDFEDPFVTVCESCLKKYDLKDWADKRMSERDICTPCHVKGCNGSGEYLIM